MLTDQSDPGDIVKGRRTCRLPGSVSDPRYPPGSLKYIFALHNHPFGSPLSLQDMRQIIALANEHEWVVDTREGKIPIAIIAFYSKSADPSHPTCDGFYQYTPETRELSQWIQTEGTWRPRKIGTVTWIDETHYRLDAE